VQHTLGEAKLDLAVVISYVFSIPIIFVLLCLISVSCCGTIKKSSSGTPGLGGGEVDEGSFGGATAVLPGWHTAPVCQGADHAVQRDRFFGALYDEDAGAR
jgi:hypothetical protein